MTPRLTPGTTHRTTSTSPLSALASRRGLLRTVGAGLTAATAATLAGCGDELVTPSASTSGATTASSATGIASTSASGSAGASSGPVVFQPASASDTLPGGGRTFFPDHRVVGYCGEPDAPGQGRLGMGDLDTRIAEMVRRAKVYQDLGGRPVIPLVELIATTTLASPGADGMYRSRSDDDIIRTWLEASRRHGCYLLLNIQPGRSPFLDEMKAYQKWLQLPDVGVALDPEWALGPTDLPGKVFGHTTGQALDDCAAWLSGLAPQGPETLMVYHQLNPGVVRGESALQAHQGVALVKSVDGIGGPKAKTGTWKRVIATMPTFVHPGFKLFFDEDVHSSGVLMTPRQVLALTPEPDYVMYE